MPQCETTGVDGVRCRGWAYGTVLQCAACLTEQRVPATELTLTVVADSYAEATQLLATKRQTFERQYPGVRLVSAGETQDYHWTKSRKSIGQRQHWIRYVLRRR